MNERFAHSYKIYSYFIHIYLFFILGFCVRIMLEFFCDFLLKRIIIYVMRILYKTSSMCTISYFLLLKFIFILNY